MNRSAVTYDSQPYPADRPRLRANRPPCAVLAVFAALNFLGPDMLFELDREHRVHAWLALLGVMLGQPLLGALWAVLGPSGFWRRWFVSLGAVTCLYVFYLAGLRVSGASEAVQRTHAINMLFLPLIFMCAQAPLWPLRLGLGRGMNFDGETCVRREGVQFRMRDVLTGVALIALALGAARVAVSLHDLDASTALGHNPWLNLALACMCIGGWSTAVLLPGVGAALLTNHRLAASAAVVLCAVVLLAGVAGALAVVDYSEAVTTARSSLTAAPNRMTGRDVFSATLTALLAFHAGLVATTLGGCHAIRNRGWTLQPPFDAAVSPLHVR